MAKAPELKVTEPSGSKKKIIMIAAGGLVLLIGIGVGLWLWLSQSDSSAIEVAEDVTSSESKQETDPNHNTFYIGMPRPFVFNVIGDDRDRLVQIKVQLLVRGSENEALAKQHIPLIESTLLNTFSEAEVEQLSTAIGKQDLREKSLVTTQQAMNKVTGQVVVERVLFTGFVMQ